MASHKSSQPGTGCGTRSVEAGPALRRTEISQDGYGLAILIAPPYHAPMTATITSKGQITIPLSVRKKLNLKPGDQLEFDETAPILTARRIVKRNAWEKTVTDWQKTATKSLKGHEWERESSTTIIDDLRGGPVGS